MLDEKRLHLVRLSVKTSHLYTKAKFLSLPIRQSDLGYVVHCYLQSVFGGRGPKPFAFEGGEGSWTRVLGYSRHGAEDLIDQARSFSDPLDYSACDWETFASKPMPERWNEGRELDFEVRVCPVVRRSAGRDGGRRGPEIDAFLHECSRGGETDSLDRERVYLNWLSREFGREGAARLLTASVERFQLARLLRRSAGDGRKAMTIDRPDVLVSGRLQVQSPEGFTLLLARGPGRHRAFGFGMLLLRPG